MERGQGLSWQRDAIVAGGGARSGQPALLLRARSVSFRRLEKVGCPVMDNPLARQRLEAQRARLQETKGAADRLSAGAQEAAQTELSSADQHPAEQATETMERELDMGVAQRMERELAEVEAALHRIDDGSYGRCEICGKAIGDERLEVMPAARYCIEDQAKAEHDPTRRSLV